MFRRPASSLPPQRSGIWFRPAGGEWQEVQRPAADDGAAQPQAAPAMPASLSGIRSPMGPQPATASLQRDPTHGEEGVFRLAGGSDLGPTGLVVQRAQGPRQIVRSEDLQDALGLAPVQQTGFGGHLAAQQEMQAFLDRFRGHAPVPLSDEQRRLEFARWSLAAGSSRHMFDQDLLMRYFDLPQPATEQARTHLDACCRELLRAAVTQRGRDLPAWQDGARAMLERLDRGDNTAECIRQFINDPHVQEGHRNRQQDEQEQMRRRPDHLGFQGVPAPLGAGQAGAGAGSASRYRAMQPAAVPHGNGDPMDVD